MNAPTPRVWLATFVTLVFTIGLLAGMVLERTVLHPAGPGFSSRGPGGGRGGPGSMVQGPGSPAQGPGGRGRGGPMFGPPPMQYIEDLNREVRLTDAQQAQILKLLQAQEARLHQMQEEARRVFIEEQNGLHERIAGVLSPEQATAFRAWVLRRTTPRGATPRGGGPR